MGERKDLLSLGDRREGVRHAWSYLSLAICQAERIETAWKASTGKRDAGGMARLAHFLMSLHGEDYAFVMALHQAKVWLKIVAGYEPTIKAGVRVFAASLPDLEELRDMWEHETDYFKGRGRKRQRWLHALTPDVNIMQEATAGSIWHDPSGRWTHRIGGRLDMGSA